jgi:hypothetical protein
MRCEDSRDIDSALFAKWKCYTRQPFVEMSNYSLLLLMGDELHLISTKSWRYSAIHTSPRNHATRYPKTTASFVSSSPGGDGIPAVFQRSAFHSSRNLYAVLVSINMTRGAPSINQRPYTMLIPRSSIDSMVAARCGFVGVKASTSTAACNPLSGRYYI